MDAFKPENHIFDYLSIHQAGILADLALIDPRRRRDKTQLADTHWHVPLFPVDPEYPLLGNPRDIRCIRVALDWFAGTHPILDQDFKRNRNGDTAEERTLVTNKLTLNFAAFR